MTLAFPFLDTLLTDANDPTIDIRAFVPPLTDMTRYHTAHSWVRYEYFENRFRCRHHESGANDAAMDIHVGWHKIELLGMNHDDRNFWYPLVVDDSNLRLLVSR